MELKKQDEIFDDNYWALLATNGKLVPNTKLSSTTGDKVYCHESYAEDLFSVYQGMSETANKEPKIGEVYKLVDVRVGTNRELLATLTGFIDATVNLEQEKKFFHMLNTTEEELVESLKTEDGKKQFCSHEYHVRVEMIKPYVKVSLYEGQLSHIKEDFFAQIGKPTNAYYGTITGKNQGGFIIEVQGINGFLPGSLAAANVVRDFDSMIGKVVPVMVEDYLVESSTFVLILMQNIQEQLQVLQNTVSLLSLMKSLQVYYIVVKCRQLLRNHSRILNLNLETRLTSGLERLRRIRKLSCLMKILLSVEKNLKNLKTKTLELSVAVKLYQFNRLVH